MQIYFDHFLRIFRCRTLEKNEFHIPSTVVLGQALSNDVLHTLAGTFYIETETTPSAICCES